MNFCIWITGLPGSGKSTIVRELEHILSESGIDQTVLSLDQIRKILTPEPKYTDDERALVYRSLALMAQLLVVGGEKNVIIDATGNRREFRDLARHLIPEFAGADPENLYHLPCIEVQSQTVFLTVSLHHGIHQYSYDHIGLWPSAQQHDSI